MEGAFLQLVNLSISAGWLVLAILVLRLVFRAAPKRIICLLWALVTLRLVCPRTLRGWSRTALSNSKPIWKR